MHSLLLTAALIAQTYQPTWESVDKRPNPAWFADARFGIFIHWGVYSVPAFAPIVPGKLAYAEWYWNALENGRNGSTKPIEAGTWDYHKKNFGADFHYQNFATQFRAQLFDPKHWADLFARSGARYVVLTSKHHEGFTLWPNSQASASWGRPWNAVETGPHRDLLGDLTQAVRDKGLKMGYYYSLYEWFNPLWLYDKPRYIKDHMTPQFKDLVTRYKPSLIFSDGEWDLPSDQWKSAELLSWLFNESPVKDEVVVNDRWGKETRHVHGGYYTTEYTAGMSSGSHDWEESRGMGASYGYNRAERIENYRSSRELVIMLADIVSRGGNFLLDIGPDGDGTIPVIMEQRLLEIGNWLRLNGEAIYGTRPHKVAKQWTAGEQPRVDYNQRFESSYDVAALAGKPAPGKAAIEAFFTTKGNTLYAILPRWPGKRITIADTTAKSVELLGHNGALRFRSSPREKGISIDLPELPEDLLGQPAWTLRINR